MGIQNEMQITFMTFFIKDLNTVKQTKNKEDKINKSQEEKI